MAGFNQPLVPGEILDFYKDLVKVHEKFTEELQPISISDKEKENSLTQKAPLLNHADFQLDRKKVVDALAEVSKVIIKHKPENQKQVNRLLESLEQEQLVPLLEKFLWQDNNYITAFFEEHKLDESLASFILFNVLKPFASSYARAVEGQRIKDSWKESYCPVCGWKPVFAVTKDKDKHRFLHCSLCEAEWSFTNMECPHCHNLDFEQMKYFTVEEDEVYRVNVCEKCKGYIKSVDEEKQAVPDNPLLTDVKTLHLDVLAERAGYSKEVEVPDNRQRKEIQ